MSHKLTVLKYGDTVFGENYIFAGGNSKNLLPITFCIYLIEYGKRNILVDTGCDDGAGFKMSVFCTPTEALEKTGLTASDITDVIITHAHADHIQAVHRFKNATIHIQNDEYALGKRFIPESLKVVTFDSENKIGDITVKKIGGHSAGSCIVLFEHGDKTVVLCGDECYTNKNLKEKIPTGASRVPEISKYFVEEYSKEKYICFTCHDPDIMRGQAGAQVLLNHKTK